MGEGKRIKLTAFLPYSETMSNIMLIYNCIQMLCELYLSLEALGLEREVSFSMRKCSCQNAVCLMKMYETPSPEMRQYLINPFCKYNANWHGKQDNLKSCQHNVIKNI